MIGINRILHILAYLSALVSVLPLLPFLDNWLLALVALGFLFGLLGERAGHSLLPDRLATLLSIGFFLLFLFQVSLVNLVMPLINLLCLLLAVRLAGDKSARHLLQLFMLATIVLASSSMLTLDMAYFFYLILLVIMVTSGLVLLTFYTTDQQISFDRRNWLLLLKTMAVLPIGSLLLMLVLFVILPRTQTPLWNFLNPKSVARTGMADQVKPGSVAGLANSGEIAFRAETEQLPVSSLYWRGIVLNQLDGQVWKRNADLADEELLESSADETLLWIYAESKTGPYLVSLDRPLRAAHVRYRSSDDGILQRVRNDGRKVRYQVVAQPQAESKQLGPLEPYLRLPANLSPRLIALGQEIATARNFEDRLGLLDDFFLRQKLSYSAEDLPVTANPVETFLFESRRGYCEYFASSYALLLRIAGVPARLVGGYLGGDYNDLGGYYLVSEDAAHVWVEALDDRGIWRRIDPSRLAANAETALAPTRQHGLLNFRPFADAMLHNWSRLVLNYDLRQQFGLLRGISRRVKGLKKLDHIPLQPLYWGAAALLPLLGWMLVRRKQQRTRRLLNRYRRLMAKLAGAEVLPADLGLFSLAKISGEPLCFEFAHIYGAAVYKDHKLNEASCRRLQEIIEQLQDKADTIEVALPASLGDNVDR